MDTNSAQFKACQIGLYLQTDTNAEIDERKLQWRYRIRVSIFILVVATTLLLLSAGYDAIPTLINLEEVERARDHWQRPGEIIRDLNLKEGTVVVDLDHGRR